MKQSKITKIVEVTAIALTFAFAIAPLAYAQWQPPPCAPGLPCSDRVSDFIIRIINIGLGLAGLVAVLFLIIGGFRYITSAGNEETAENAKKIITNAIIGVVVIILAFVIVRVISNALITNSVT